MAGLSTADHGSVRAADGSLRAPRVTIPRDYNAAHDLIERNLAAGRAYDMYSKTDIGGFLTGGVADSYRAAELMDIMTKRNYVGASLRKSRAAVSLLSFGTPEAEKRQHCDNAKQLVAGGKLDADSKSVAADILDTTVCKNMAAAQAQQQQ